MNDCPPRSSLISPAAWEAELRLDFAYDGARTVLRENRHRGPLRVQKALYPEGDAVCQAIVLHPPSGIAGGDRLAIDIAVGARAHAQVTTPGAGKWYRSGGADAAQALRLSVAAGGVLEWLPQESIVFDGARAHMTSIIDLADDSRFIGWDMLCLGRAASGERFGHGRVDLLCRIDRCGRPLWRERGGFNGGDAMLASPTGWAGATVCGTLLAVFPELSAEGTGLLEAVRATAPADGAQHSATVLPGLFIARYLGHNGEAGRAWFARVWSLLRPAACGRAAIIPRIWNT